MSQQRSDRSDLKPRTKQLRIQETKVLINHAALAGSQNVKNEANLQLLRRDDDPRKKDFVISKGGEMEGGMQK